MRHGDCSSELATARCDVDLRHCITCSDEGQPMRVVRIDAQRDLALCQDDDGARSSVEIALVAPVTEGDVVLVHAGTALVRL